MLELVSFAIQKVTSHFVKKRNERRKIKNEKKIKYNKTYSYLPKSDESRKPLANGFESIFNLVIN